MGTVVLDGVSRRRDASPPSSSSHLGGSGTKDLGIKEPDPGQCWVDRARGAGGYGTLGESEREELARLRRQDAQKNKHVRELEMEIERGVLKRCMTLWVK